MGYFDRGVDTGGATRRVAHSGLVHRLRSFHVTSGRVRPDWQLSGWGERFPMAYFLTSEAETAAPAKSLADPKTHTPLLRVKERGLRYYSASLSRWVNRDPIGEEGGSLLYGFVENMPSVKTDADGRFPQFWSYSDFGMSQPFWDSMPTFHVGATILARLFARGHRRGCCTDVDGVVGMCWYWGRTSIDDIHEFGHIGKFRQLGFLNLVNWANALDGNCHSSPAKADCWISLLENEVPAYYRKLSEEKSHELDAPAIAGWYADPNYATRHPQMVNDTAAALAAFSSAWNSCQAMP